MDSIYKIIIGALFALVAALAVGMWKCCRNRFSRLDFEREKEALVGQKEKYLLKEEFEVFREDFFNPDNPLVDGIVNGNDEIGRGNFRKAELDFKQELFRNPDQANAWVGLAHAYTGRKRFMEALKAIETAIALDSKSPFYNKLGQVSIIKAEILMKLERYTEAVEVLEKEVLAVKPDFRKALELLATAQESAGMED
ncbi:MAG: tetratricopeptide repeat protein [bacterium]|nr:tetratricopeptide repeat protein [bacterium]